MAQPKKRKHAHHTKTPPQLNEAKKYSRIIPVAIVIFILFGVGIAFLTAGANISSLIIGGILGAIGGFAFGYGIAQSLAQKRSAK
ncbi:MAG: hypothetical protein ABIR81_01085 [Ginsengibacter sp.]